MLSFKLLSFKISVLKSSNVELAVMLYSKIEIDSSYKEEDLLEAISMSMSMDKYLFIDEIPIHKSYNSIINSIKNYKGGLIMTTQHLEDWIKDFPTVFEEIGVSALNVATAKNGELLQLSRTLNKGEFLILTKDKLQNKTLNYN